MAAIVLAHVKVADYDSWREKFESKADLRKDAGCLGTHIFYNSRDNKEVIINFQWESEERAQAFLSSPAAQQAMSEAGVQGGAQIWFLADGGRTAS